jgi:hypothetical protein
MEHPCETAGDLALGFREVGAIGIETVGPEVCAGIGIDQLHVHLNLVAGPSHASFQDIANAEIATNLFHVNGFALVGKGRVPGDHEASGDSRQIRGQIIGDPVGEIFLLRIVRQILEGQDDDRQPRRRLGS